MASPQNENPSTIPSSPPPPRRGKQAKADSTGQELPKGVTRTPRGCQLACMYVSLGGRPSHLFPTEGLKSGVRTLLSKRCKGQQQTINGKGSRTAPPPPFPNAARLGLAKPMQVMREEFPPSALSRRYHFFSNPCNASRPADVGACARLLRSEDEDFGSAGGGGWTPGGGEGG